jgi:hypothetical protein
MSRTHEIKKIVQPLIASRMEGRWQPGILCYGVRIFLNFCFLLAFMLLFSRLTCGQNQSVHRINVIILDQSTHEGIDNVNIKLMGKNIGTVTMVNGFGSLLVDSFPAKLSISHISYIQREMIINKPFHDTLMILLNPKVNTLDEIVVSSESKDCIVPSNFTVIDFSICDNTIYALGSYTNNLHSYKVLVLNSLLELQNTIELIDINLPESLFCDCLNNCHVLTKKAAYQIVNSDSIWETCCEYDINDFHSIMDDCLLKTSNHLIFKHITNDGFSQAYYGIDLSSNEKHYFVQTNDFDKQKSMQEELKFLAKNPGALRMEFAVRFEKEFMFKPRKDALMRFGDTIFHFNFNNAKICYYSELELNKIGESRIDDRLLSSIWNDDVFFDKANQKSFVIFKDRLFEINTLTGQIVPRNAIMYSAKQIINGGYIYYMQRVKNPFRNYTTIIRERIE